MSAPSTTSAIEISGSDDARDLLHFYCQSLSALQCNLITNMKGTYPEGSLAHSLATTLQSQITKNEWDADILDRLFTVFTTAYGFPSKVDIDLPDRYAQVLKLDLSILDSDAENLKDTVDRLKAARTAGDYSDGLLDNADIMSRTRWPWGK